MLPYAIEDVAQIVMDELVRRFNDSTAQKVGSVPSSGRGLIAVGNEEVNAEESRQVYVPCVWKAVSIYSSYETKPEGPRCLVLYIG